MKKILLIQADEADGVYPSLALMKLSAYHKARGDEVFFRSSRDPPDEVYISCVYTWNKDAARSSSLYYPDAKIHLGGTGLETDVKLPDEVEHLKPDYSLYPDMDYSMGFTSRGCIRNCPWCVVPKTEGWIREHSPIEEFLEPNFPKITLMDGNFLASPKSIEKLHTLIELKKKVCFNQGLDIRLVTEENAELLSQLKYYDQNFKRKRLYFAWDIPEIEKELLAGVDILLNAGIKPRHLMFYVLIGFDTNYKQDIHRVKTLLSLGTKPYVMLYNHNKGTYHHHLKRWTERRYCYVVPWEEYKRGDSQVHIKREEEKWSTEKSLKIAS